MASQRLELGAFRRDGSDQARGPLAANRPRIAISQPSFDRVETLRQRIDAGSEASPAASSASTCNARKDFLIVTLCRFMACGSTNGPPCRSLRVFIATLCGVYFPEVLLAPSRGLHISIRHSRLTAASNCDTYKGQFIVMFACGPHFCRRISHGFFIAGCARGRKIRDV